MPNRERDRDQAPLTVAGGVAVVTGAASGIGRALAGQLVEAGLAVAIADIDAAGLERVARKLADMGGDVLARPLDTADAGAVDAFAATIFAWADGRPVPLVFANAGIHGIGSVLDADPSLWQRVVAINLMGPVHAARAFVPRMDAQGSPSQFVITGSQASFVAAPGLAPYVASKHAVWGLADSLRMELAAAGSPVGVSLVAPGRTASAMVQPQIEAARARGGDAGAASYEALLTTPDRVAAVMLREAIARSFWIIPSHESVEGIVRGRFAELDAAFPAGRIA